jgi:peptidoglycan/LPS O-acetylase OafA/YrhL
MKYEAALDGLRAVAIVSVVVFHAFPYLLPGGGGGVELFFVLSGYLITRLLREEYRRNGRVDYAAFYMRRALRLMPALWTLLAVLLVAAFFLPQRDRIFASIAVSAAYLMNWSRAFGWWPQDLLGHTWSLAIEEQFYILWPIVLVAIRARRPLVWICLGIVAIAAWGYWLALSGASAERIYNGFDTHAYVLLVGCGAAFVEPPPKVLEWLRRYWVVAAGAVVAYFVFYRAQTAEAQIFAPLALALASAWLIVASKFEGMLKRILSLPPMTFTGRISYGFYLWHYPLLGLLASRLPAHGRGIIPVVAAYAMATISYFTVEKLFRELKKRFETTRSARERAAEMDGRILSRSPAP